MNADDFRDYMLSLLFLRYLSDNYEATAHRSSRIDAALRSQARPIAPMMTYESISGANRCQRGAPPSTARSARGESRSSCCECPA